VGVIIVGVIVIAIVATAGMASTTYVQFLKGGLLLIFSSIMVIFLLVRGIGTDPASLRDPGGRKLLFVPQQSTEAELTAQGHVLSHAAGDFAKFTRGAEVSWWKRETGGVLWQTQWAAPGVVNGQADGLLYPVGRAKSLGGISPEAAARGTGVVSPVGFLARLTHPDTRIEQWHTT
jgi:cation/acetate symporter